jgi:hypothetical protein
MSTTVVVILGVMALASLTQAAFLVLLALEGRRMARRVDAFQARAFGEVKPIVGDLTRATENLAAASAVTVGQARRIDALVSDVALRVSDAQGLLRDAVLPAATRLVSLKAALTAARKAIGFYRRVRG